MKKILSLLAIFFIFASPAFAAATKAATNPHPHLNPITWKGEKWEYLVEFPHDIRHVDPARMEELMDNAGQHGWELEEVSHEDHFYVFYFKRPLHEHRVTTHRDRLNEITGKRKAKEAKIQAQIDEALNQKPSSK